MAICDGFHNFYKIHMFIENQLHMISREKFHVFRNICHSEEIKSYLLQITLYHQVRLLDWTINKKMKNNGLSKCSKRARPI